MVHSRIYLGASSLADVVCRESYAADDILSRFRTGRETLAERGSHYTQLGPFRDGEFLTAEVPEAGLCSRRPNLYPACMALSEEVQIRVVPHDEQVAALWLLFAADSTVVRRERVTATVRAAIQKKLDFEHLLEAHRGGTRVGVVWGQSLPGRNANIWPPSLDSGESPATADLLQAALDARLVRAGLGTAQALLSPATRHASGCLSRQAYVRVADLLYLKSQRPQFPFAPPPTDLAFEPYHDDQFPRLASVVEATYVETRDAPALDGMRSTAEVIAGYRGTGQFAPERWFFVRSSGTDIGCLLLTDHPSFQSWELVYMGLIPAARGRGRGRELVRFAQWQTYDAGREEIVVGVDSENGPAVAAYARCGFFEVDRGEVWVKRFINPVCR